MRYLREKIDRPFGVRSIETVRGAGYRLRKDGGAREPRLPIRLRLTAAFAVAMVVVLAGAGAVRLPAAARPTSTRASTPALDARARPRSRPPARPRGRREPADRRGGLRPAARAADGRVLDAPAGDPRPRAHRPPSCARAAAGERGRRRARRARASRARRACSRARRRRGRRGRRRRPVADDRDETLGGLVASFAIGGPVAVAARVAARATRWRPPALRPVEAMRRRAAGGLARAGDGERLPLPAGARRDPAPRGDAQRDARPAPRARSSASGASSPTPATSCARRSP